MLMLYVKAEGKADRSRDIKLYWEKIQTFDTYNSCRVSPMWTQGLKCCCWQPKWRKVMTKH